MYCAYFIVVLCRSTYVLTMHAKTYRNVRTYVQNHSTLLAEKIKYTILFYTDSSDYVGMVQNTAKQQSMKARGPHCFPFLQQHTSIRTPYTHYTKNYASFCDIN